MASKLKIDLSSASPGSSRPASSLSGGFTAPNTGAVSKNGDQWESFKGKGETLGGRKTKGKGISHRKPEKAPESSKIFRTDQHRIVSNSTLASDIKVPAPLTLPFGQLFFGFNVATYTRPPSNPPSSPKAASPEPVPFTGSGNTLNGRGSPAVKGKDKGKAPMKEEKGVAWGAGHALGARSATTFVPPSFRGDVGSTGPGGARLSRPTQRSATKQKKERSPSPDWGVDDDDVIMVDSD